MITSSRNMDNESMLTFNKNSEFLPHQIISNHSDGTISSPGSEEEEMYDDEEESKNFYDEMNPTQNLMRVGFENANHLATLSKLPKA